MMSMPLQIKHRRTADIPESIDMPRKLSEKVDDLVGAGREGVPQDERREKDRGEFLEKGGGFDVEEFAEFRVYL
jgi:hypothetical protein